MVQLAHSLLPQIQNLKDDELAVEQDEAEVEQDEAAVEPIEAKGEHHEVKAGRNQAKRDEWGPWQGDVEKHDKGAENPGVDDWNEEDFEVEEAEKTKQVDPMEPAIVDAPKNEPEYQERIEELERALEELIQEDICQESIHGAGDRTAEQEMLKSTWGTPIAPQEYLVPK